MRSREDSRSSQSFITIWLGWLLVAGILLGGPGFLRNGARIGLAEATGLILNRIPSMPALLGDRTNDAELRMQFERLQSENRALRNLNAKLQRHAEPEDIESQTQVRPPALLVPSLVTATFLGRTGTSHANEFLLSAGRREGLRTEALVLGGHGLLVDAGSDFGIRPDQLVTAGRFLCGRTTEIGRWTSIVQPLTDPGFRVAVRIVRTTELGSVLGGRGILRGNGSICQIDEVPGSEAVTVGDSVYTDDLILAGIEAIYCGEVIEARLNASDSHWTILVKPAASMEELPSELHVIQGALNPQRLAVGDSVSVPVDRGRTAR